MLCWLESVLLIYVLTKRICSIKKDTTESCIYMLLNYDHINSKFCWFYPTTNYI